MKLQILAIGVHPDDVELGCAGTLLAAIEEGKNVGILDLTRGELGTRGTAETRKVEAKNAANILGVQVRENLGMADGFFQNDEAHQRLLITAIRKYQPDIILANAPEDRHPDLHGCGQHQGIHHRKPAGRQGHRPESVQFVAHRRPGGDRFPHQPAAAPGGAVLPAARLGCAGTAN